MVLQVHPFAGGIGGDQEAQGIQLRWAVEAALEGFPFLIADAVSTDIENCTTSDTEK